MNIPLKLTINGWEYHLEIKPYRTLLEVIRIDLGLTGTKEGCGAGECGACTVLVDNQPVNACLLLAVQADGKEILTIEGLAQGEPHPLQTAFVEHGAIQCGYCTPGLLMASKAMLDHNPEADKSEIKEALSGNICRCTGYQKIIEAVSSCSNASQRQYGSSDNE